MDSDRELARRELRRRFSGMDHGVVDARRQQQIGNLPDVSKYAGELRGRVNDFARNPAEALYKGFETTLGMNLGLPIAEYAEMARNPQAGQIDPNAPAMQEAMGWFPGPMGALGTIAGKGAKLPMDEASRMQRAKEMGFDTDTAMYHGTGKNIEEFNRTAWMSEEPGLANMYADARANMGEEASVMPLIARTENTFDADLLPDTVTAGSFLGEMLNQASKKGVNVDADRAKQLLNRVKKGARTEGSGPHYPRHDMWYYPSMHFGEDGAQALREFYDMVGIDSFSMTEKGEKTLGVIDPKNIRSKFAKFDPSKKESANLLAGIGGLGLGLGYLGKQEEHD